VQCYSPVSINQESRECSQQLNDPALKGRPEHGRYTFNSIQSRRKRSVAQQANKRVSTRINHNNPTLMQQPHHHVNAPRQAKKPKALFTRPPSYLTQYQYEPSPHTSAQMQCNMQAKPINITTDVLNKQRYHRLSSSSEEADEMLQASNNDWQIIRRTKRPPPPKKNSQLPTYNYKNQNRNIQPLRRTHNNNKPS
jgi:hypothetical protein